MGEIGNKENNKNKGGQPVEDGLEQEEEGMVSVEALEELTAEEVEGKEEEKAEQAGNPVADPVGTEIVEPIFKNLSHKAPSFLVLL